METRTAKTVEDLKGLTPIAKRWMAEAEFEKFGLDVMLEKGLQDLSELITGTHSDLIMLMKEEQYIGFMGIRSFASPLGDNLIAEEHYMYILPEHRGRGGLAFLKAAKKWAKENMCTHLILNASCLASDMHDKVCKLYEYMGLELFESSYMTKII